MSSAQRADPIFIHGIMPRSGTNYLWDLLLLHPACAAPRSPIREDFFLECSDLLVSYAEAVRARWDPMWGALDEDVIPQLLARFGHGLVSYLSVDPNRRLVAKTPSVVHLDRFFTFFPEARLIVLVRDGRSVVQSCMSTFGWDLDRAARTWADAAEEIVRSESDGRLPADRYIRVRYEELIADLEGVMGRVLRTADLDEGAFDLEAAKALPVRGSSVYLGPGRNAVHWDPVARGPDFDPLRRWTTWTPEMHERFGWIAGGAMHALGYQAPSRVADPAARAKHVLLDVRSRARAAVRWTVFRARVRVGTASRPLRERFGLARRRP